MAAELSDEDELAEAEALAICEMDGMAEPGMRGADGATGAAAGVVATVGAAARGVDARVVAGRSTSASLAAVRVGLGLAAARVVRRAVVCARQPLTQLESIAAPSCRPWLR